MSAPSVSPVLPGSGLGRAVEVYDFRRPTTLAREHSRVLELAFETFARQWGTLLTTNIRAGSAVVAENVKMVTYDEYAASLPAATAMVLCEVEGQEAKGVIQFPTEAALFWITRMLGGSPVVPLPNRKFTLIEQSLVKRLMDDALEDLQYSFGSLLSAAPTVHGIHFNSQFAQAAATNTLMIVADLSVTVGEHTWAATVALPAESLLKQMGSNSPRSDRAAAPAQMRAQVSRVPVDVELSIGPVAVRPRVILNLAVGDVVLLEHAVGRPFELALAGESVARAVGVTHGSRQAGQIVSIEESAP
ncbi:flagellar motor switch protein FliM [Specibacter sp. RAF43]|uniref:flagellar motor switch protein FliM n=1 Tax=Specibacter sp. RAF43 TaxID=3233057 RepID=UPI003F97872E